MRARSLHRFGATMWITVAVLVAVLAVFGVIALTFFTRGTPVKRLRVIDHGGDWRPVSDPRFCEVFSTLTNTAIAGGNRVEILANGEGVFPRLWDDLESAEDLITWHVFWFKPGELADRLADILVERSRAGVDVLFLYDYVGSIGVPDAYYDRLREAGVEVSVFRKPRWNRLYKFQQRMHTRAVVIDGRIGYTGGFAIADEWSGDGRHPDQWRDTSVRLEGPIVGRLQTSFVSNWAEACGELLVGERVFPADGDEPGATTAGLMFDAPSLGSTNAERFFVLSIGAARERLYLTNPYFVPDQHFRRALIDAVDRGVDVRVLTPGRNNDRMSTYHAARAHYEELIEGGVRLYDYGPTMVHAKTLVADGIWASVGTVNFDNRSMVLNDEVAMVARDPACGEALERLFLEDLEHAHEVTLDELRERGALERLKERFYLVFSPLL
jgi:cardiolipin synthase